MTTINVKKTVQIDVEMKLSEFDAEELLFFLKTACTAPRPMNQSSPDSNIVRILADAIMKGMK